MPTRTTEPDRLAGRYRLIERLGAGGMAAVYLAHDERLDRRVAVKRLHTTESQDPDARRFKREARLGASLSHPNLVSIFDTVEDDESVVLVMEYLEGDTLADRLASGAVDPARAVAIVRAVAAALDHAHAAGIVHRDVKPGNVLIGRDGSVKLADLGIAKALERTDITGTGTVLGTPGYMAPEQLEGGRLGPAVDVYALAAMAFELVTGRKARRGRTPVEIAHQVMREAPPDARDFNPTVPAAAADAIRAGMARHPADRPRSAGEFAERLALGLEHARPVATVPRAMSVTRRSPRWVAVLALTALAMAALVIGLSSGSGDDEPRPQSREEERPASAAEAPSAEVPKPQGAGGSAEAERLHLEGHAALLAGDYKTAIELNTRAIEAFPEGTNWESDINYAYALYSLGRALRLAGRPDEAIPVLEQRRQIPDQTATVQQELDLARAAAE